jgi:hypothetical protein
MINSPDITAPSDFNVRAGAGNFLKAPLLTGSTQNEGDIFIVAQEVVSLGFAVPVLTQLLSDILTLASAQICGPALLLTYFLKVFHL